MTATEEALGFRWDRLTTAAAAGYAFVVPAVSVGVVLGELREQFDLSGLVAALHGSGFGVGLLTVGLVGTRITSRLGLVSSLRLAAAAIGAGVGALCLGPRWPLTLAGSLLAGLAAALIVMIIPGLISDHHGPHRATAFAAVNAVPGLVGIAFSAAVGIALSSGVSWRPAYLGATAVIAAGLAVIAGPVRLPAPPETDQRPIAVLGHPAVRVPWLAIVVAVGTEFPIGVWAAAYLKEVGGASGGLAAILAGLFGFTLFASRVVMPAVLRVLGPRALVAGFVTIAAGPLVMCFVPSLPAKVAGVLVAGFGAGPLYPLTVDRLYAAAGEVGDSITLGAVTALASGTAISLGPLGMGILADATSLRWAVLLTVATAAVGIVLHRDTLRAPVS